MLENYDFSRENNYVEKRTFEMQNSASISNYTEKEKQ